MTPRLFLLALLLLFGTGCGQEPSTLEVHLRCPDSPPAGTLTIHGQSFDIPSACRQQSLKFESHRDNEALTVRLHLANSGSEAEAKANYGEELQRDRTGFHVIFEVRNDPPFLRAARL